MGIAETYSRGRRLVVDQPVALVVALLVVLLVIDMLSRLAAGSLAFSRVGSLAWNGLMRGLVIGLAGVGLSMTYSILNFANFAHGDTITAGAFSGWAVTYVIAGLGVVDIGTLALVGTSGSQFGITVTGTPLAVLAGAAFAGLFTIALVLVLDRIVYRPMRDAGGITLLITSIGVALALRYLLAFVFDTSIRGTTDAGSVPRVSIPFIDGVVLVTAHDVALLVVGVALMFGIHLLLQRTKLGKSMRAMSDNEALALITGIPTERVIRATWIIGGGLTGVAGYMFVLWKGTMGFNDGWLLLLLIFAAVILGGIGSVYGAIAGGLTIGLARDLSLIWIPSDFARATAFAVMIVILLVKPTGLFSGRSTA
jgi:branched-chain amino acid transport system permease protein